jgi:hypothetical protein
MKTVVVGAVAVVLTLAGCGGGEGRPSLSEHQAEATFRKSVAVKVRSKGWAPNPEVRAGCKSDNSEGVPWLCDETVSAKVPHDPIATACLEYSGKLYGPEDVEVGEAKEEEPTRCEEHKEGEY